KQACGHTPGKRRTFPRNDRQSGPQGIRGGGMAIIVERIERKVRASLTREVFSQISPFGENKPLRRHAALLSSSAQIPDESGVVPEEPKHAALDAPQKAHPNREYVGSQLVTIVEAAIHKPLLRQAVGGPGSRLIDRRSERIVDLETDGDVKRPLREKPGVLVREDNLIRDNIVKKRATGGSGIAQIGRLHRRRMMRKNAQSRVELQSRQVDGDVDPQ